MLLLLLLLQQPEGLRGVIKLKVISPPKIYLYGGEESLVAAAAARKSLRGEEARVKILTVSSHEEEPKQKGDRKLGDDST